VFDSFSGTPSDEHPLTALVFCVDGIGHRFVNNPLPLNADATGTPSYTLTVDNVYDADTLTRTA
jgi:hypothetical protein